MDALEVLECIRFKYPEQSVWLAVLKQAVQDAWLPALNGSRCSQCKIKGGKSDHRVRCPYFWRSEARNWLSVRYSTQEGSFPWVCTLLNFRTRTVCAAVFSRRSLMDAKLLEGQPLIFSKRLPCSERERVEARRYNATGAGQERNRRYQATTKGRARNRRYESSTKGKARQLRYRERGL